MHADNFEPVILVSVSFQNYINLPVTIGLCEVHEGPFRHCRYICIGLLEWQLPEPKYVRVFVDKDNHSAELYIGTGQMKIIRFSH